MGLFEGALKQTQIYDHLIIRTPKMGPPIFGNFKDSNLKILRFQTKELNKPLWTLGFQLMILMRSLF